MNIGGTIQRLQKALRRQNDADTVDRIRQACEGMEMPEVRFIALASHDIKPRIIPHLFSQQDEPEKVIDGIFRLLPAPEQPEPSAKKEETNVNLH